MRPFRTLCFGLACLLVATFSSAQAASSPQFLAAKNIASSKSNGGVYATGDINRDGKLDIVSFDLKKGIVVLLGNGNGTFTEKAPSTAINPPGIEGVQLADVNRDGFLDLILDYPGPTNDDGSAAGNGAVIVYLGDGTGDFHQRWSGLIGAGFAELAIGDFNGDGHPDIVTATDQTYKGAGHVQVFLGNGNGTFQPSKNSFFFTLFTAADFNGDGKTDLAVIPLSGSGLQILLSKGDGTFKAGATYAITAGAFDPVRVADLNGDGHLDLIVSDTFTVTSILLGKGDGTFSLKSQVISSFPGPSGTADSEALDTEIGDFNRDGKLDLMIFSETFAADPTGGIYSNGGVVSIYPGKGDGTFSTGTHYSTSLVPFSGNVRTAAVGDFNRDGNLDVVTGGFNTVDSITTGVLNLLPGSSNGRLQAPINTVSKQPFSIVHADLNRDGIEDIAVVNQGCSGCNTTVSVFLGTGKGYFGAAKVYPIGQMQGSIAAGDINGDGKMDLVVTRATAPSLQPATTRAPVASASSSSDDTSVLLGNGNGTFRPAVNSVLLGPAGLSNTAYLVDMNRDGKLDLVGDWGVALGKGDGTFRSPRAFPSSVGEIDGVGIGDLNGDGIPDVIVYNSGIPFGPGVISALLGDGTGAYTVKSKLSFNNYVFTDVKVAKVYGGKERDLIFAGQSPDFSNSQLSTNLIGTVRGNGDGTFSTKKITPIANFPSSLSYGDYDRDGKLDVVVDNSGVSFLRGKGDGTFYAPQFFAGTARYPQTLDVNGDGAPDVVGITPIGFERLLNTGKRD